MVSFPIKTGLLVVFALLSACKEPSGSPSSSKPPSGAATTSALPLASMTAAPPASASSDATPSAANAAPAILGYEGKLGERKIYLALDRTGDRLGGVRAVESSEVQCHQGGGEAVELRGNVRDGTHVFFSEVAPKGKQVATFDGVMDGPTLRGTWTEPPAAGTPFTASPHVLPRGMWYERVYLGSLGSKTPIRAKLRNEGGKLSGVYRYIPIQEDLHLGGVVTDEAGTFELEETNGSGVRTGTFQGILLDTCNVFGRWSSADGSRAFPVALHASADPRNLFPYPEALPGGSKIVPQEEYFSPVSFCQTSIFFPKVVGAMNAAASKALNAALKDAAEHSDVGSTAKAKVSTEGSKPPNEGVEGGTGEKMSCEGWSDKEPYWKRVSYEIDATRPGGFVVQYSSDEFGGGNHPLYRDKCFAADLDKGTLTELLAGLLSADARKKISAIVVPQITKDVGWTKDWSKGEAVSDTTSLCVDGTDLVVQFQIYEVASYPYGSPSVKIAKAEAAALVAGTPLEPFFR